MTGWPKLGAKSDPPSSSLFLGAEIMVSERCLAPQIAADWRQNPDLWPNHLHGNWPKTQRTILTCVRPAEKLANRLSGEATPAWHSSKFPTCAPHTTLSHRVIDFLVAAVTSEHFLIGFMLLTKVAWMTAALWLATSGGRCQKGFYSPRWVGAVTRYWSLNRPDVAGMKTGQWVTDRW